MGNSIVVVRKDDRIMTALFADKELITIGLESTGKEQRVGDIFIGKVQTLPFAPALAKRLRLHSISHFV